MKKCPYCAEQIQDEAIVCRYCGRELVHQVTPQEELSKKREDVLNKAVADHQTGGWILISNSGGIAQLKKPKSFNWAVFLIGMLFLFIVGILYLIIYVVQSDEILNLTTDEDANLVINSKMVLPADQPRPQTFEEKEAARKSSLKVLMWIGIIIVIVIVFSAIVNS